MPNSEALVYTVKEVAAKLNISYKTALRMIESGQIRAVNVCSIKNGNKIWRVPKEQVDDLLAA